jgi:hypothetical protein
LVRADLGRVPLFRPTLKTYLVTERPREISAESQGLFLRDPHSGKVALPSVREAQMKTQVLLVRINHLRLVRISRPFAAPKSLDAACLRGGVYQVGGTTLRQFQLAMIQDGYNPRGVKSVECIGVEAEPFSRVLVSRK